MLNFTLERALTSSPELRVPVSVTVLSTVLLRLLALVTSPQPPLTLRQEAIRFQPLKGSTSNRLLLFRMQQLLIHSLPAISLDLIQVQIKANIIIRTKEWAPATFSQAPMQEQVKAIEGEAKRRLQLFSSKALSIDYSLIWEEEMQTTRPLEPSLIFISLRFHPLFKNGIYHCSLNFNSGSRSLQLKREWMLWLLYIQGFANISSACNKRLNWRGNAILLSRILHSRRSMTTRPDLTQTLTSTQDILRVMTMITVLLTRSSILEPNLTQRYRKSSNPKRMPSM